MSQYPAVPPGAEPPLDWPHYGIGFLPAVKRGFRKYAVFSGRASRGEYWWFALGSTLLLLVPYVLGIALAFATSPDGGSSFGTPGVILLSLAGLVYVAILLPSLSIAVRRLHDAGYSGWFLLLSLVPLASIVVFVFTLLPTSPQAARYGPPYPQWQPGPYQPGPYQQAPYPPGPYPPG